MQTQGADRVTVELPGATDKEQIRSLVGQHRPARLRGCPCGLRHPGRPRAHPLPDRHGPRRRCSAATRSQRPARVRTHQGRPAVDVELKADGARIFDDFASKNFTGTNGGVKFAIVLDGDGAVCPGPEHQPLRGHGPDRRQLHHPGGEQRWSRSSSSARCRWRSREVGFQQPERRRSARNFLTQTLLGGLHRHRPRVRVHAHPLPAARARWRASRCCSTRSWCTRCSGSSA